MVGVLRRRKAIPYCFYPKEKVMTAKEFNDCLRMIRDKDSRGMARFYKHYYKRLRTTVLAMIRDEDVAEDMASDLMCRIFENADKYGYIDNPNAWMYSAAKNAVVDYIRQNNIVIVDDEIVDNAICDPKLERSLEFGEALSHFDRRVRMVLLLHYAYGYNYDEIADDLGISLSTVKRDIISSRSRLAFYLKNV